MIFFAVLLTVSVFLLLYLFFAPFYLEINSALDLYRIRFHHLFSINLKIKENMVLEINIFGWKHKSVLKEWSENISTNEKKPKPLKGQKIPFKKALRVAATFKVNKCYIDIDFGDMQFNGIVYPLFAWLSWYSGKHVQVNFTGRNVFILEIENSIARMSRAWLGSKQLTVVKPQSQKQWKI